MNSTELLRLIYWSKCKYHQGTITHTTHLKDYHSIDIDFKTIITTYQDRRTAFSARIQIKIAMDQIQGLRHLSKWPDKKKGENLAYSPKRAIDDDDDDDDK